MPPPLPPFPTSWALEQCSAEVAAKIRSIGRLHPGTLVEVHTECGRPNCHRKRTIWSVPSRNAAAVRSDMAECQGMQRLANELIEVSDGLSAVHVQKSAPVHADPPRIACAQLFGPAIETETALIVALGTAKATDFDALDIRLRQHDLVVAERAVEQRFNDDFGDRETAPQACWCRHAARYSGLHKDSRVG